MRERRGIDAREGAQPVAEDRQSEIEARAPRLSRTAWVLVTLGWVGVVCLIAYWTVA